MKEENVKCKKNIANVVGANSGRQHIQVQTKTIPRVYSNLNSKWQTLILNSKAGITLIALIITIIIMLILVGVTISVAINGGLFTNAKQAKTDTQNALSVENELSEGKVNIDGKIYNSIDEYIEEIAENQGDAVNVLDYGKIVTDYKSEGNPDLVWKVFYEDKDNVYLISETADGDYPEKEDISAYSTLYESGADVSEEGQDLMPVAKEAGVFVETNKNKNILATAFLCDTEMWENYLDEDRQAAWAMGGATVELYLASYNATQKKEEKVTANSNGYNKTGISSSPNTLNREMNNGIYILKSSGSWYIASPFYDDDNETLFTVSDANRLFT